jgi:hypothetical protein
VVVAGLVAVGAMTAPAQAASSNGCENGGGFRLENLGIGATVAQPGVNGLSTAIPAVRFGPTIALRGRYTQFDVRATDFAALDRPSPEPRTRSTSPVAGSLPCSPAGCLTTAAWS